MPRPTVYTRLETVAGTVPVPLYLLHVLALVVHITILGVCANALASTGTLPLYRSSFSYAPATNNTHAATLFTPNIETRVIGRFHFWPIVVGFTVPSIVEHAFYVFLPGLYGWWMAHEYMGWVRFTSYGISAPLMNWATNYLCGVGEPIVLCTCATLIVIMLAIGYVLAPGDPSRYLLYGGVGTLACVVAFLPGIIVAASFDQLPAVVSAIIALMVLLYFAFGMVFFCANYFREDPPYIASEYAYAVLSLTSKVFLSLMITFGVVMRA